MSYETILFDVADDGVARITLNRPEALNAMTRTMGIELQDAVRRCAEDDVRVVVLTGAERAFSSGADLKSGRQLDAEGNADMGALLTQVYNPLILQLRQLPKPVISAVNGPAVGYALSLALTADLVVAADSAYFLLAFINIGLVPDGGATYIVPSRVGFARAAEFSMLGQKLPAPTALEWGLINQVVPLEELPAATDKLAQKLANGPLRAYAAHKALYNRQLIPGLEAQLGAEAAAQYQRGLDPEVAEGIGAFVEKRQVDFRNAGAVPR